MLTATHCTTLYELLESKSGFEQVPIIIAIEIRMSLNVKSELEISSVSFKFV